MEYLSLGIDFGTDSGRAVVVGTQTGNVIYSCQHSYPRWAEGKYCAPAQAEFHQHPLDYVETLDTLLKEVAANCPDLTAIKSIAVDSTCSTPCLVDGTLTPLALRPEYAENPGAMFVLWKDKSGFREAADLKARLSAADKPYLKHCGNTYSAEYTWSKILYQLNNHKELRKHAWAYLEEVDFLTSLLTGRTAPDMKACIAPPTIKGLWSKEWGGFPVDEFRKIDPDLARIAENTNYDFSSPGTRFGKLSDRYVREFGFSSDVTVATGAVDAHSGVIGSGSGENTLGMSIGTSACYWLNFRKTAGFSICPDGLVGDADSIMVGDLHSTGVGLSAFGDIFAWFKNVLCWGRNAEDASGMIDSLSDAAANLPLNVRAVIATDKFNGRRSPFANDSIRAGMSGLSLSTTAPEIFRALVEAAAFATKASVAHLQASGIRIDSYRAVGGVAVKSPYVMQVLADVLEAPVSVCSYTDIAARGAAVYGAVAAGIHESIPAAQAAMTENGSAAYTPCGDKADYYRARYARYRELVRFNEELLND